MRYLCVWWFALLLFIPQIAFATEIDETLPNRLNDAVYVSSEAKREAEQFRQDVLNGRAKARTHVALNALMYWAAYNLEKEGHWFYAKELIWQWENEQRVNYDLGDHAPLSQWIADQYNKIEGYLGVDLCHLLRLDDIKTLNYAIPVVFACVDGVGEAEYLLHFRPLCGLVMYWSGFFTCVGFTWGTGFFFCGPIAMGAEFVVERWVAPALNKGAWNLACN